MLKHNRHWEGRYEALARIYVTNAEDGEPESTTMWRIFVQSCEPRSAVLGVPFLYAISLDCSNTSSISARPLAKYVLHVFA